VCGGGGGTCVDTHEDPSNCGDCTNGCGGNRYCKTGGCECLPGYIDCGGTCVDPQGDGHNCGGCGNTCGKRCVNGACFGAPDPGCSGAPGRTSCGGGSCFDLQNDVKNCGSCGHACGDGQLCAAGSCQDYTPAVGCSSASSCDCSPYLAGSIACPPLAGDSRPICVKGSTCPSGL